MAVLSALRTFIEKSRGEQRDSFILGLPRLLDLTMPRVSVRKEEKGEARTRVLMIAVVALAFASTGCSLFGSHPSDAFMIDNFSKHRALFERLVAMSNIDKEIVRLTPDFTYPEKSPGLTADRWQEYRELFRLIGSRNGIARYEAELPGAVFVLYSDKGLVVGGSSKGYVYSVAPLEPLLETLDEPPADLQSNVKAYRSIEDGWYIFYSWDD